MNKRQMKKLLHRTLCNVRKINLDKEDYILIRYNRSALSCMEISKIVEGVKNNFQNNKIIAIPDKTSLNTCSNKDLEEMIVMIQEQLKI